MTCFVSNRLELQFITWAVTNTCDDALTETSDPIILQGPHAVSRGELEIRHGPNKVVSARRAFEGITAAVTLNSPLLRKIQEIGSPSLAMAEIRRHYVPTYDLEKQAYLREYMNAEMVEGEEPALYFERISIIREKLAEVGIHKTD